jgi:NTE family protein
MFYEDVLPAYIRQNQEYIKLTLALPLPNKFKGEVGAGYAELDDDYYQTNDRPLTNSDFDHSYYQLYQLYGKAEYNTLKPKQYHTAGKQKLIELQYRTGWEYFIPHGETGLIGERRSQNYIQAKAKYVNYLNTSKILKLGVMAESVAALGRNLGINYTSSILQAPAFTPTPHSKIIFNEAFRANQYLAAGLMPIIQCSKLLQLRTELYAFLPVNPITRSNFIQPTYTVPTYKYSLEALKYMGEISIVLNLPFVAVSVFANAYSFPNNNFNAGLNIGYIMFNEGVNQ